MKLLIILALAFSSCMTEKKVQAIIKKELNKPPLLTPLGQSMNAFDPKNITGSGAIAFDCLHRSVTVTTAFCPDTPCNTATCTSCGKKWSSY